MAASDTFTETEQKERERNPNPVVEKLSSVFPIPHLSNGVLRNVRASIYFPFARHMIKHNIGNGEGGGGNTT